MPSGKRIVAIGSVEREYCGVCVFFREDICGTSC